MIVRPVKIFMLLGLAVVTFIICSNIYQTFTNPYVDYTCRVYHIDGRAEIKHLIQKFPHVNLKRFFLKKNGLADLMIHQYTNLRLLKLIQ